MGQARAPSQGRSKGKAKTKGGGKDKGRTQGQGSGKGSPPAPSARFSWTLCLRPPTSCTYRVAATTRAALAGTPGSVTTSETIVRCEPSSVKGWRQPRAHNVVRARFLAYPVARVSRLRPLPAGNRPPPPKAPPRDQQGRRLGAQQTTAEAADAARGDGPPSPTGDSYESSTEAAEEENPARPGTPTPWARRTARKTTAAESAALPAAQHVSLAPVIPEAWEPDEMEAGSLSPPLSEWEWPSTPRGPNPGDFVSLSEVAAALPCSPGWPGGSSHGS